MSSCSRISVQALLQSVQEMVQSLSELHDLRRQVREAEASFAKAKRLGFPYCGHHLRMARG
jgi:hypothetical protein